MEPSLQAVQQALERGDAATAAMALAPVLDQRANDDPVYALAAQVIRAGQFAPGPMDGALAAAVDRLVALVREQDAHIAALRAMVERGL